MSARFSYHLRLAAGLSTVAFALAFAAEAQPPTGLAVPAAEQDRAVKAKYAAARAKVQKDPEYQAAVKRAEEARMAAEKLFFEKMRRADAELRAYLDRLEKGQAKTLQEQRGQAPASLKPNP
jgi:hypothetical protein